MTNLNSQHTIDGASTDPVTRHLMQTRERLMQSDASFYLGDPAKAFTGKVVWKRIGRGNRLVTTESAAAVDAAQQAEAAADTNSADSADIASPTDTDPILEAAVLSAIVVIDFDDCWLTPCGHWKGPNKVTKKFEDLKMSFQGKAPTKDFLAQDFSSAVNNAKILMYEVALGGAKSNGFLTVSRIAADALRFRHVVFEELTKSTDNGSDTASDDDSWTMSNWPVIHSEAELISPNRCNAALAGATVRVTFTLNHWFIDNASKDQSPATNCFVADVQSIRVLINPTSQAMSPKKRKTARRDPADESPKKRNNR
ncbi:hypothetical protein M413DRAFT_448409 [Hebeloma cylindrosporum]|uniref:Uncharacterized protein n=1 Tax=Hebeloma cylindrosporum TaxID=76867 RepID=A0A0C2Y9C5_HEBCY|nr:hypothetical protein M413DRAFT_448409 [Hebeloma cylindrosporum h7]